ncbi:MAG: 16S rRNA processing protein RimM [Alphaproteobacteria bacterium]|nr:16S rRNA processing protein RimM [Alphaproteobacteria bacterium]
MTVSGECENLVCVGVITTAHGVRGLVKVKSFTQNAADFAAFGALSDASAKRSFNVQIVGSNKDLFLVQIDGVTDRNAAEALRGTELFVARSQLPETAQDEFYYADLIGMTARTPDGKVLGTVKAMYNFGAGDMLEINGVEDFISFSKQNIPDVDLKNRVITVCLPESVEAKPEERPES